MKEPPVHKMVLLGAKGVGRTALTTQVCHLRPRTFTITNNDASIV